MTRLKCFVSDHLTFIGAVLIVAWAALFAVRSETIARDSSNRANQEQAARLSAVEMINAQLSATQDQILQETRDRTTESCKNTAAARETNRNTLLGLIDAFIPKNPDGTPVSLPPAAQARVDLILDKIRTDPPPLTCPQDQGPIVIPVPSTPTTAPPVGDP